MKKILTIVVSLLICTTALSQKKGVVVYPSDILSLGLEEWEKRIDESGIDLIGIHAATFNEPIDTLKMFVTSDTGKAFLKMCRRKRVDVEYELHVLQLLLPRDLFKEHPEYFRMGKSGKRVQKFNMCFTCEDAYKVIQKQVDEMMQWLHPTTHRYLMWTDDVKGTFCNCEKCRGYSPSEQALLFENRLLEMIRKHDPKATVAHLAYEQTMEAPVKVKPAEGVFLEYAPISRNYEEPLPEKSRRILEDNLKVFPRESLHILEYWLDESMFCHWKKKELVELPFSEQNCRRDINLYRNYGAASITTFATWLNAQYVKRFGPADRAFSGYGKAFDNGRSNISLTFRKKPGSLKGLSAPWDSRKDDTQLFWWSSADSLHFRYEVNESSLTLLEAVRNERDLETEDRVELFFSATPDMSKPYYCIEIDPKGRRLDYAIAYYRDFDYAWTFPGCRISSDIGKDRYTVSCSVAKETLRSLGINTRKFWLGAFRADFRKDGSISWYSLRTTSDKQADFHKPDMLVPCK